MSDGGRVVIPAEFRRALNLRVGDELVVTLEGDRVVVESFESRLKEIRALVRKYVPAGVSLSEELIQERRAEAARE
jgi:AbrB family looped-hinge helix DNA binding protein